MYDDVPQTDQARAYQSEAWAVVRVFEPAIIEAARADITAHIDSVARALHMPFEASDPQESFARRLEMVARHDQSYADLLRMAVCTDAHRGPRLSAIVGDSRLREAASDLCGVALGQPIFRVRANIPTLERRRHGWHSDVALPAHPSDCARVRITAWIPLMDSGPETGGLEVIPGFRDEPIPHIRTTGFEIPEASLEGLPRVQPNVRMGEALFLDRYVPHRTLPPKDLDATRWSLVVWLKGA